MRNLKYIFLFLLACLMNVDAQDKPNIIVIDNDSTPIRYKWLGSDSKILTSSMKMKYKKPPGFQESSKNIYFKNNPKLEEMFYAFLSSLKSSDGQFFAGLHIFPVFTQRLSEDLRDLFSGSFDYVDKQHVNQIRALLKDYYGDSAYANWRNYVHYYSPKEAKEICNADTMIRFTINLKPEDYYEEKFKYIDALFLQKKGRGYVNFYCFYTEEAKKNLNKYWRKIERTLKYEN